MHHREETICIFREGFGTWAVVVRVSLVLAMNSPNIERHKNELKLYITPPKFKSCFTQLGG